MAANKFATMVHKNTNKITLILVYAVLEWTLILLLLLNSLLSYLIIKFAKYFGLKPPCLWCSRVDHFFEPEKGRNFHRDLLCEAHATEISQLGYCSNHQKLAAYQDMCEDCLSSRPYFRGISKNFTFFPWVKEIGIIHGNEDKVVENGEVSLKCSCCGLNLEKQIYSPYVLIPPNWDDLEDTHMENLLIHQGESDDPTKDNDYLDRPGSYFLIDHFKDDYVLEKNSEELMISNVNGGYVLIEEKGYEDSDSSVSVSKYGLKELKGQDDDEVEMLLEGDRELYKEETSSLIKEDLICFETMSQIGGKDEACFEIHPQHLEFFIDFSGQQLVPIELIDSATEENEFQYKVKENQENSDEKSKMGFELDILEKVKTVLEDMCSIGEKEAVVSAHENLEETKFAVFESMEMEETENSLVFHAKECYSEDEKVITTQAAQTPSLDINDVQEVALEEEERDSNFSLVCKEISEMHINGSEPEVSIEAATAELETDEGKLDVPRVYEEVSQLIADETDAEVSIGTQTPDLNSTEKTQAQDDVCLHEDPSTSCRDFRVNDHEHAELRSLSIELSDQTMDEQLSGSQHNGTEEENIPDTPTSLDTYQNLHKKLLLLDRKESGTEESLDGSVITEFSGGVMTVEHLTSALRAERKALHVVYAELEEERSASAVAANQTMAMINRLQEEKAAMQMEALQYQRMMEEQSEYDQEALQLMNELMVKREREKQELEKELEFYRKKVMDYEAKEKMRMLRRSKDGSARSGFSSASCYNEEESDGTSIDSNQEVKDEDIFFSHQENGHHNTPVDAVINMGDTFGEFEEERMSILEQLKVLEDKLFMLSEDEQHFEDVKPIEHFYQENGKHLDENYDFSGEVNGVTNDHPKEMNGKHDQEGTIMGAKAKRLLPLFDAVTTENEDGVLNGHENGFDSIITRFELEERRVSIEEEVDQVYARLHALETDKEFLKHCISSMRKGDKGVDLLQEILQHLRDLRNMELRVKNFTDGSLV